MALVVAWTVCTCTLGAVACLPIRKMWDQSVPGTCINIAAYYYGIQVVNIMTDIYIIIIPVNEIYKLPLSISQKVSLWVLFGLATL